MCILIRKGSSSCNMFLFIYFEKELFPQNKSTKKSYIEYQTHYIQKKEIKAIKETRNIKRRKKKKWG